MAKKFVPVALEVNRQLEQPDETGRLFKQVVEQGHYGRSRAGTRQGTYLVTPAGDFLVSGNEQNPEATLRLMRSAQAKWDGNKHSRQAKRDDAAPGPRSESVEFPDNAICLTVDLRKCFPRAIRDTPIDPSVFDQADVPRFLRQRLKMYSRGKPESFWEIERNQDHAWLTQREARRLLPESLTTGASGMVDQNIVNRLARLHMLDTVRTLADFYSEDHVKETRLRASVTSVNGDLVSVRFEGRVFLQQSNVRMFQRTADRTTPIPKTPERSYRANLLGRATYNQRTQNFELLEIVALGTKAGGSRFSPFPETAMGIAFTLVESGDSTPTAPRYFSQYDW